MKNFLLALFLLTAGTCFAQCSIPLCYPNAITDQASYNSAAPTIGAVGTSTVDPDFGSRVLRVTNSASCGAPAGNDGWSPNQGEGWKRSFRNDDGMVLISGVDSSADYNVQALTRVAGILTTSGSCISLLGKMSFFPGFSPVTTNLLYGFKSDGSNLVSWDLVSGDAAVTLHDMSTIPGFTKVGSRLNLLEFDDLDHWFCTVNSSQDSVNATQVGCWNKSTGDTQVLNITAATEKQNSATPVALNNLSSANLSGCYIHEMAVGSDASWMVITLNGCSAFPDTATTGQIFWQMGTTNVGHIPSNNSSHSALGPNGAYINAGHNQPPCATYDNRGLDYWVSASLGTASLPNLVEMYGCTVIADGNNFDAHVAWRNNKNDANVNTYPVIALFYPGSSGDTNHASYLEWEIVAIDTAPAFAALNSASYRTAPDATVWRFAHTFNDAYGTACPEMGFLSPNVSRSGKLVAFSSTWLGQTGTGTCTNNRRYDMFIVDASSIGAVLPPTPSPGMFSILAPEDVFNSSAKRTTQ